MFLVLWEKKRGENNQRDNGRRKKKNHILFIYIPYIHCLCPKWWEMVVFGRKSFLLLLAWLLEGGRGVGGKKTKRV